VLALLFQASCIIIPTYIANEKPFLEDDLTGIVVGATSRSESLIQLGSPLETFVNGRWAVWHADRQLTEWFVFIGTQAGAGAATIGGGIDRYTLILEFDDHDFVSNSIVVHEKGPCSETSILCYRDSALELGHKIEKTIPVPDGHCRICMYFWSPEIRDQPVHLGIEPGGVRYRLDDNGKYYRLDMPVAAYTAKAMGFFEELEFYDSTNLDCLPGERVYLRIVHEMPQRAALDEVGAEFADAELVDYFFVLSPDEVTTQ